MALMRGTRRLRRLNLLAMVLIAACMALASPAAAQDSNGTDFWLAFPGNLSAQETKLFIAGGTATSGTVTIPGLAFTAPFTVTPGTVTTVDLPNTAQMQSSNTVEGKGVHVTAANEVAVYGLNRAFATTDAYLALPTDALGTDYIDLGYKNVNVVNANQFGIAASQNATTVTITPTVATPGHPAGTPYTVALNQGQTYLLRDTNAAPSDLSGSIITADKPISVYGGHQCANIPPGAFYCDHIVEQLTATTQWGKNFLSMPLATRTGGDTFRILATAGTTVKVNGTTVATLNRGELHEQLIDGPAQITADNPVLVMQYSNGTTFDNKTGDPFQMLIPPFEQYLASYTVSTPASGFDPNFINVVAPNSAVGSVKVDGTAIPAAQFTAIGGSGFSGAQVSVTLGSHTVTSPQPVGVHSYGFGTFDSYGYSGGLSLSPVATVTNIALSPKTATNVVNSQHCVTAHVTDQNNAPVDGVRVDFVVTGANTASGFVSTNMQGNAQFCYTGSNLGDDTIKATVGTLSDTAAKKWVTSLPPPPPPPGGGNKPGGNGGNAGNGGNGGNVVGSGGNGGVAGPCGGGGAGGGGVASSGGGAGGGGCFAVDGVQSLTSGRVSAFAGVTEDGTTVRADAFADLGGSTKGRASRTRTGHMRRIGRALMRRLSIGRYIVIVHLNKKARRALKAKRKAKVLLRLQMTAPTGAPLILTRGVTLKR